MHEEDLVGKLQEMWLECCLFGSHLWHKTPNILLEPYNLDIWKVPKDKY